MQHSFFVAKTEPVSHEYHYLNHIPPAGTITRGDTFLLSLEYSVHVDWNTARVLGRKAAWNTAYQCTTASGGVRQRQMSVSA